ncbi:putative transcription factor C2H2 family [Helianthus anomalus]
MYNKLHNLLANGAKKEELVGCTLCNIICLDMQQYNAHASSSKHLAKVDKATFPFIDLHCGLCNIFCTSSMQLDAHLRGKKHATMMLQGATDDNMEDHRSDGNEIAEENPTAEENVAAEENAGAVNNVGGDGNEIAEENATAEENVVAEKNATAERNVTAEENAEAVNNVGGDVQGDFGIADAGQACMGCQVYVNLPLMMQFCAECYGLFKNNYY